MKRYDNQTFVNELPNYTQRRYIVEQTGEIFDGFPASLNPSDYGYRGTHCGYDVISYVWINRHIPQSSITPYEINRWKDNNGFAPGGELKYMNRYYK